MSDMLAIVEADGDDTALIEQLARRRPGRVTVLVQDTQASRTDWAMDDSKASLALRHRLATLLHRIETQTGAAVVGLVGDADQLAGWRFDRVVRSRVPVAA